MLQTQNLCKYFRKQKAVNNVSLNIEKGQIYGLLGPNGAGKSTTLKMLTGMMKPTAGKIYFDGKLWDRKDGIYPEQKNEPFCQAEGNRACSNCQGEKWKNEIQPIDFRLEDNEMEIMRDMIAKSQINE